MAIQEVIYMTDIPRGEEFLPLHTKKDLISLYQKENDLKAKVRLLAAIYRKEGLTYQGISERLKYPLMTVADWLRRLHEEGLQRRYSIKQSGRPNKLTDEELSHLESVLLKSPQNEGLPFLFWTTKLVQYYIEQHYNVSYKPRQVRNILHNMGMTCQKPRPEHIKANKKAQKEFKKKLQKELNLSLKMDSRSSFWTKASFL
jgi:transposase